ncbi:MAG: dUTP diphosphatase [Cyanobacteria bacterium P01_H01_bin.74]
MLSQAKAEKDFESKIISTEGVVVPVYRLPHAPDILPHYATPGSAAMDIRAAISAPVSIGPLERALIPTGLVLMIPEGYECQLRPRSGLAIKHGITLINGVGTIDSDYRDEVKVALVNLSQASYAIEPNERIAQMLFAKLLPIQWVLADAIDKTTDRKGGFGSTGLS